MKQVLATYINHSRVRFLEPTSTGVRRGIMVMTHEDFEPPIPWLPGRHLIHWAIAPLRGKYYLGRILGLSSDNIKPCI